MFSVNHHYLFCRHPMKYAHEKDEVLLAANPARFVLFPIIHQLFLESFISHHNSSLQMMNNIQLFHNKSIHVSARGFVLAGGLGINNRLSIIVDVK